MKNPSPKAYSAVTKNLLKQLARGERVRYNQFELWKDGEKLLLRGELDQGEMELHFRAEGGDTFGLSMDQVKKIVTFREKPLFQTTVRRR